MNAQTKVIEFESMLHESVQRVGRAVRNLRQEMGGYPSSTPGSGSPGAGKNARSTEYIRDATDPIVHEQRVFDADGRPTSEVARTVVEDGAVSVGVTSVERLALGFTHEDRAAIALAGLDRSARSASVMLGAICESVGRGDLHEVVELHTRHGYGLGTVRVVVLAYARCRRLVEADANLEPHVGELDTLDPVLSAVFRTCQQWGYDTRRPATTKDRADLLAVDLTERWCTSHLRVGVKRERSRGELCDWCYRHGPLLVATWAAPPRELVQLHVDNGRVYAHEVEPFIRAERDRQRNLSKAGAR